MQLSGNSFQGPVPFHLMMLSAHGALQEGTRVTEEGVAFQRIRLGPTLTSFDPQFRINPKPRMELSL